MNAPAFLVADWSGVALLAPEGWLLSGVYGLLVLALALATVRLVRGPGLTDRVLALDFIGTTSAAVIAVTVVATGEGALIDAGLAVAMVSFLGVVAFARFIEARGQDE